MIIISGQEIDDLRAEAKHAAKYMKAFFDFKTEAVIYLV
jgi:hypothetical protein